MAARASPSAGCPSSTSRAARSPSTTRTGRCHVILNGEIYNFQELRGRAGGTRPSLPHPLRRRDRRPRVRAVGRRRRRRGCAACSRSRSGTRDGQRLLLARDRLGKKPLVYHEAAGRLAFASELQALLRAPGVPRAPDLEAIHDYLTYQYVPHPRTAFAGVRKLPPAHLLVFENGQARLETVLDVDVAAAIGALGRGCRRRGASSAARRRPRPPHERGPAGRVPLRRHRLQRGGGPDVGVRTRQDVLRRVRGGRLLGAALRAAGGHALRHGPSRVRGPADGGGGPADASSSTTASRTPTRPRSPRTTSRRSRPGT